MTKPYITEFIKRAWQDIGESLANGIDPCPRLCAGAVLLAGRTLDDLDTYAVRVQTIQRLHAEAETSEDAREQSELLAEASKLAAENDELLRKEPVNE